VGWTAARPTGARTSSAGSSVVIHATGSMISTAAQRSAVASSSEAASSAFSPCAHDVASITSGSSPPFVQASAFATVRVAITAWPSR
jgi:hypothetical protein